MSADGTLGDHDHGHAHTHAACNRAFAIAIALNAEFVAVEVFYGWQIGSRSLLAEAGCGR